jgi:hypothetical protein
MRRIQTTPDVLRARVLCLRRAFHTLRCARKRVCECARAALGKPAAADALAAWNIAA